MKKRHSADFALVVRPDYDPRIWEVKASIHDVIRELPEALFD